MNRAYGAQVNEIIMSIISEIMDEIDSILTLKGLKDGRHEIAEKLSLLRKSFPNDQKEIDNELEKIRIKHKLRSWNEDNEDAFKKILKEEWT